MSTISNIGFRGETVNQCPQGQCSNVQIPVTNFKGYPADTYENSASKKSHAGGAILGILATAAATIAAFGCLHKAGKISAIKKEGWFKNTAETVTGKCHEWCGWTKNKIVEGYNAFDNWLMGAKK